MTWKLKAVAALSVLISVAPLHAQAPEKGKLLVATDSMRDPNYSQTVVLLLHHDSNGTLGVALNRPTWLAPQDVRPEVGELATYDGAVFRGGPIEPTQLIFLVRDPPAAMFEAPPVLDDTYASGNLQLLDELVGTGAMADSLRLYAGHSEWPAGQIEREIALGRWKVVDGNEERVFAADLEGLWRRMSTGGDDLLVDADALEADGRGQIAATLAEPESGGRNQMAATR